MQPKIAWNSKKYTKYEKKSRQTQIKIAYKGDKLCYII